MRALRAQLAFLRDRAEAIASGAQKLDGSLRNRARQYANAARAKYWDVRGTVAGATGKTRERRVLGDAEHCPDCLGYAAQGWVPIGTLPPPGEGSVCRSFCACRMEWE